MGDGGAEYTKNHTEISSEDKEERYLIGTYQQYYLERFLDSLPGPLTGEQLSGLQNMATQLAEEKRADEKRYKYDRLMNKLLSRAGLDDELERTFKVMARDPNSKGVMVFIDVNNLKKTNDELGHNIGDDALRIVSDTIGDQIRKGDVAGRYGGDEVILFLKDVSVKEAALVATRARQNLQENSQELRTRTEGKANISFSIGLVPYRPGITLAQTRKEADETMYVSKHQLGKDAIAISGLEDPGEIENTYNFLEKNGIKAPIVGVPLARQEVNPKAIPQLPPSR